MPTIDIYPSTLQRVLLAICRGAALVALLSSAAPWLLRAALAGAVLGQMLAPRLRQLFAQSSVGSQGRVERLGLGAGYCQLVAGEFAVKYRPPHIRYLSEWLIILDLQPVGEKTRDPAARQKRRRLLLWPDSLSTSDNWRLRRYLEAMQQAQREGLSTVSTASGSRSG